MKHKKGFAAVLLTLIISALLSVSAFAASDGFSDVPEASPFYESVTYLAGQGITYGTGNGRYAPDTPITVRQWATMICRAFDKEDALSDPAGYGGDACINQGYADGWLNLPAMAAPDSRLCRYAIYESGFAAFDIALYSSQLYPEGEALSSQDNAFHAAVSFGLCEDTCAGTDIITRGEAADLLYALLTGEFTVAPPPILETIPLNNKEGVHLNSYLLELQKIPEPIRQAFAERGWQYTIDYEYLARLSEERNMSCIGATNYGSRQITVSSAGATVHEFGHFLDELIGFPSQTEGFYQEESGTAAALLRPYALTNEREYFADCFVYWLTYRDNSKKMAALCSAAPRTYAYFSCVRKMTGRSLLHKFRKGKALSSYSHSCCSACPIPNAIKSESSCCFYQDCCQDPLTLSVARFAEMIFHRKISCIGNTVKIFGIQCVSCKMLPYTGIRMADVFRNMST